jgi:protein-disulfide isomerase
MDTTQEGGSLVTRRNLLIFAAGLAAVGIAGTGAGYYFLGPQPTTAAPQPAPGAEVSSADLLTPGPLGDQVLGPANAPVTIIEYASMTCPHCAHFHETTYPEMKKKYIDTGKLRFIFREFPLDALAAAGSMLARCAGKDKFFPLVETLFAQQKEWVTQKPLQPMLAIAKQAGFTQESFDKCLANQEVLSGIEEGRQRAVQKLGVQSTPTFFINGKIFRGTLTIEELDKEMAPYLKG